MLDVAHELRQSGGRRMWPEPMARHSGIGDVGEQRVEPHVGTLLPEPEADESFAGPVAIGDRGIDDVYPEIERPVHDPMRNHLGASWSSTPRSAFAAVCRVKMS
jgi:hypothetical protein